MRSIAITEQPLHPTNDELDKTEQNRPVQVTEKLKVSETPLTKATSQPQNIPNPQLPKKPEPVAPTQKPIKLVPPTELNFDGMDHVLYVGKGTLSCKNHNHNITSITGILASLRGNMIKINIYYCADCQMAFIDETGYKYYCKLYGGLLGNIKFIRVEQANTYTYNDWAEESVLHMYGYTVSQTEGLRQEYRWNILGSLMDRNIMKKTEIINYLQFFIRHSQNRYNMRVACQKWQDDLAWVRKYNIDKQKRYIIRSVKKY